MGFSHGSATGQYETFDFTEVERSASGGVQISGDLWGREKDQIGIGGVLNGISAAHANYLAARGTGLILGDDALSYSGERILEAYYKYTIADGLHAGYRAIMSKPPSITVPARSDATPPELAAQSVKLSEKQIAAVKVAPVEYRDFQIEKTATGSIDFNQDKSVQVFTQY